MFQYRPDPRGIEHLLNSDDMGDAMVQVAESGADHARSLAESFAESGTYRDSFAVEPAEFADTKHPGTRRGAFLVNEADYAAQVEWVQGRHVLSQTIDYLEGGA